MFNPYWKNEENIGEQNSKRRQFGNSEKFKYNSKFKNNSQNK